MCRISRFVALSAAKPNLSLKTSGLMSLKNLFLKIVDEFKMKMGKTQRKIHIETTKST